MPIVRFAAAPHLAGAITLAASVAHADLDANIVDLGTLGGEYSAAVAINESGQVAGLAQIPDELGGDVRAFLYDHGTMLNLGTLGGYESAAVDINDAGQVVGYAYNVSNREHAFLYSGGVMLDLGTLGGQRSEARDINESGQVVGYANALNGDDHAFLYSAGVMLDLGTFGGDYSYAEAINDAGQVAGYADSLTERHAFRYSGGVLDDLGTLGGVQSAGFAINESGDVVGVSFTTGNTASHAFLYDASDDMMLDLGTLGGSYGNAYHVNASGQAAGDSLIAGDTEYHAFLWSNGVMTDLSTPGTTWSQVMHLSDAGEVLFTETDPDTFERRAWYYKDGVRKAVGTLGGLSTDASDMNSSGTIVGSTWPPTPADGQHGFMTSCPLLPSATCNAGARASVQIRDDVDDEKNLLKWKWSGGSTVVQADLGEPADETSYALCIYDSMAGVDGLATVLRAGSGDDWRDKDPKGWTYSDRDRADDGIGKLRLQTGAGGKPKALLSARGGAIPMPTPFSGSEMFDANPSLTVQLVNDSTSMCWTSEFVVPGRNEAAQYSARTP